MYIDPSGYKWKLFELYRAYYIKRYNNIVEDGVKVSEILGLCIEELFFPLFQDPLYSYLSIKSGTTLVKGYSVGAGFIFGATYSYQRVYTPDGKIVDQSVSSFGAGPNIGLSASSSLGVLFTITDSSQMEGYGSTISGDFSFIHFDMDRYSYQNDLGYDLGINIGVSLGAGLFAGRTRTKELRLIYD